MVRIKKHLLPLVGIAAGIVTYRQVRKRKSETTEREPIQSVPEEPETPTEHAKVAAEHSRRAVEKTAPLKG